MKNNDIINEISRNLPENVFVRQGRNRPEYYTLDEDGDEIDVDCKADVFQHWDQIFDYRSEEGTIGQFFATGYRITDRLTLVSDDNDDWYALDLGDDDAVKKNYADALQIDPSDL